ncbi:MAG: primosomal protein N' [Burkholderia sp.]|nr:primosomal protein N' [Burkholderia sp.]
MKTVYLHVALDYPLVKLFDYRCDTQPFPLPGTLVQVPFRKRHVVGLVCGVSTKTNIPLSKLRNIDTICIDLPPLSQKWLELISFSANYYQRSHGEVGLQALPRVLRNATCWKRLFAPKRFYKLTEDGRTALPDILPAHATALNRLAKTLLNTNLLSLSDAKLEHPKASKILDKWISSGWVLEKKVVSWTSSSHYFSNSKNIFHIPSKSIDDLSKFFERIIKLQLTDEQVKALTEIVSSDGFSPFLLYGVTSSGKTEVYLHALLERLKAFSDAQVLVLVPEINLTPQFEAAFRKRFSDILPADTVVTLHSGLTNGVRFHNWLAAHTGRARIVLGTRVAVLASLPFLALIIVDEEHESGYKQQERFRYSARDLAVWRAKQLRIPIILGSATPSLESWWKAKQGHYSLLTLSRRVVTNSVLPTIQLVDLKEENRYRRIVNGLTEPLIIALKARLMRGEQSIIFLNRRGYAPALVCHSCGWVAVCSDCNAYVVLYKQEHALRCHHCGLKTYIYRSCPKCGNIDITALGQGTQRIEETLKELIPSARILRIDSDNTRLKGSAKILFSNVHAGKVDILVGTQMISKGHDFRRVSLVGVLNADTALFSHDFRASERLFAQLIQVSGRAGRSGLPGDVLIQTCYPKHALYLALKRHDYTGFANATLDERREANLPPFIYQALLRVEAITLDSALIFLRQASVILSNLPGRHQVIVYDAVPMRIEKIANLHRAQLLIESDSRASLNYVLKMWKSKLILLKSMLKWHIDVDPLDI